jgi:hypothetical protein
VRLVATLTVSVELGGHPPLRVALGAPEAAPEPSYATGGTGDLVEALLAVLREAGGPLHVRAIYERVLARGVAVPGSVPLNNISAHLSRHKGLFKHATGRGMWRLAET